MQKTESINDTTIEKQGSNSSAVNNETLDSVSQEGHVHTDECQHDHPVPLSPEEIKALNRSQYEKISDKFSTSYVIQNIKTGKVVEIKAASPVHACNIIGWRPRHVNIISERKNS